MKPPFSDASESEVLTRVAYQLVRLDFKRNPARYVNPSDGVHELSWELRFIDRQPLHLVFAAFSLFLSKKKGKLIDAVNIYVARARYFDEMRRSGKPWARAGAPPVSNTGGTAYDAAVLEAVLNPFDKPKKARSPRAKRS